MSQNVISLIENGQLRASQAVLPLCRELGIHPPTFFEDERDESWVRLGRRLRDHDEDLFRRALAMVSGMVDALGPKPR